MKNIELTVIGMTCNGCAQNVEKVLGKKNGVDVVKAHFKENKVTIKYDDTKLEEKTLIDEIETLGFDVIKN